MKPPNKKTKYMNFPNDVNNTLFEKNKNKKFTVDFFLTVFIITDIISTKIPILIVSLCKSVEKKHARTKRKQVEWSSEVR